METGNNNFSLNSIDLPTITNGANQTTLLVGENQN